MPRWLLPWLAPLILVIVVVLAGTLGAWAAFAVAVLAVGGIVGYRARQLGSRDQRDDASYTRLSDLMRPRR